VDQGDDAFLRFDVSETAVVAFTDRIVRDATPNPDPSTDRNAAACFQPSGPGGHWAGVAAGWHAFIDTLAVHVGDPSETAGVPYPELVEACADWLRAHA